MRREVKDIGKKVKKVEIYTDGACSGNPGIGGWGAILIYKGTEKEISGAEAETTNNRMELTAIISALKMLKEKCALTIYSDSAYSLNPFIENWLDEWIGNNWKTKGKSPVKNVDLWQELLSLLKGHKVEWVKVKGHADNVNNNRCDKLARQAIESLRKETTIQNQQES